MTTGVHHCFTTILADYCNSNGCWYTHTYGRYVHLNLLMFVGVVSLRCGYTEAHGVCADVSWQFCRPQQYPEIHWRINPRYRPPCTGYCLSLVVSCLFVYLSCTVMSTCLCVCMCRMCSYTTQLSTTKLCINLRKVLRASAMLKHVIDIGWTSVRPSVCPLSVRHTLARY